MTPVHALSPRLRWLVLGLAVLVVVVSLAWTVTIVATRSAGDGLGDRLTSLRKNEVPASGETTEREKALSLARQFALRFNTYDPEMADAAGHLPEYASVADLMTAKFEEVFTATDTEAAIGLPLVEELVAQTGATSAAQVYAVGLASQDADSAEVLVAGVIEVSRPYPDQQGRPDFDSKKPDITSGPRQFRYQVSLVKTDGEWRVDDLDNVDDGYPSLADADAQPSDVPSDGTGGLPSDIPTDVPTDVPTDPSPAPTGRTRDQQGGDR